MWVFGYEDHCFPSDVNICPNNWLAFIWFFGEDNEQRVFCSWFIYKVFACLLITHSFLLNMRMLLSALIQKSHLIKALCNSVVIWAAILLDPTILYPKRVSRLGEQHIVYFSMVQKVALAKIAIMKVDVYLWPMDYLYNGALLVPSKNVTCEILWAGELEFAIFREFKWIVLYSEVFLKGARRHLKHGETRFCSRWNAEWSPIR